MEVANPFSKFVNDASDGEGEGVILSPRGSESEGEGEGVSDEDVSAATDRVNGIFKSEPVEALQINDAAQTAANIQPAAPPASSEFDEGPHEHGDEGEGHE